MIQMENQNLDAVFGEGGCTETEMSLDHSGTDMFAAGEKSCSKDFGGGHISSL